MAFVNLSLLAGGIFVAIPVVLHLIMQQRRIANQRRLQLRHWLLLALRCLAIALVAIALARPSVTSAAISSWIAAGFLGTGALVAGLIAVVAFTRGLSNYVAIGAAAIGALLILATLFAGGRALAGRSPVMGDQEAPVAAVLVIDTAP